MPKNMVVRLVADASSFSKKMEKAGATAESAGKRMKKALSIPELGDAARSIMGYGNAAATAVKTVNDENVKTAKDQVQTLTAYRDMLKDCDIEDIQVDEVSNQINKINAALDTYKNEAVAAAQAQNEAAYAAAQSVQSFQEVESSAESAGEKLSVFQRAGQKIHTALDRITNPFPQIAVSAGDAEGSVRNAAEGFEGLKTEASETATALAIVNPVLTAVAGSLVKVGMCLGKVLKKGASTAWNGMKKAVSGVWSVLKKIGGGAWSGLKKVGSHLLNIGKNALSGSSGLKKLVSGLKKVSLASLAFSIAQAAVGKLKSIVSEYISENETLKAQTEALKSGLGQSLAPAINLVTNAMSALMPYVLGISNAISSMMSALLGDGWSAAADGAKKTADATSGAADAQEKMNSQLMGFDQINRMDSQKSSSGGSGGGSSATTVTDITPTTPAWLETYKKAFIDTFTSLEFQSASVGGKIGMALNTAIVSTLGLLEQVDFMGIGQSLAGHFNDAVGAVDWSAAGRLVGQAFTMIPSIIMGFLLETDWALVAQSLSEFLISALDTASEWVCSVDWFKLGESVLDFIQNVDWSGIAQSFARLLGTGLGAAVSLVWGFLSEPLETFWEECKANAEENGGYMVLGILQGIWDGLVNIGQWLWDNLARPIIDGVKDAFDIHSPSKVFAEIGEQLMSGLTGGIANGLAWVQEKLDSLKEKVLDAAEKLKRAFSFDWELPSLKLPHLQVDWDPVDNVVAKFFGVTAIPRLSVNWFAKGGILDGAQIFGAMGSTLLGGGEAGREAILPLDSNTGWMDDLARRVATSVRTDGGTVNATINLTLDGKVLTSYVIKDLRSRVRSGAVSLG